MTLIDALFAGALIAAFATFLWWLGPGRVIGFIVAALLIGLLIWAIINAPLILAIIVFICFIFATIAVLSGRARYGDRYN